MRTKIDYFQFDTIPSTNTWAMENAAAFNRESITVVISNEQTAGRGRLNRHWISPGGVNLYATFCFFVEEGEVNISNIPQILALAVAEILHEIGIEAQVKWPNDIFAEGKKMGGILTETKPMEECRFIAVGLGLNVNSSDKPTPTSTSLYLECGEVQDLDALRILIEERFIGYLSLLRDEGFGHFSATFSHLLYKPPLFQFQHGDQRANGLFYSLNEDGSLTLLMEDGQKKTFYYGEILT